MDAKAIELLRWIFDYLTSECDWDELEGGNEREWWEKTLALMCPPEEDPALD